MRASRFLLAAGSLAMGAVLVWLASAVPVLQGAAPGSALDAGPAGLSGLAEELRDRGVLAATVRLGDSPEGLGLSPTPWDQWRLQPRDTILSVRADVPLRPGELAAVRPWLEAGGRLVVVADTPAELAIARQAVGTPVGGVPLRDAAFLESPARPVVPDGPFRYQLDRPLSLSGGVPVVATAGLSWTSGERPRGPQDLGRATVMARYPVGNGTVVVLGDSHPLSNAGRADLDNQRLADRIVEELVAGGGAVFVDEGHRGGASGLRVDLALRGVGTGGRVTLALLMVFAVTLVLFPWPARLAAALRQRLARTAPPAAPTDPLEEVAARHPDWDPRLLARLLSGPKR